MEFAREVAEMRTMDDTLNRLEGMISGVDPKEESVTGYCSYVCITHATTSANK